MNGKQLSGKRALVAGASRGIGLAIARQLAEAGAHTILASRSLSTLETLAAAMREHGLSAEALAMDTSDRKSIEEASARHLGDVDILINVAGTNIRKRFEQYTVDEYEKIMNTNLHGLVALTQKVGARMIERGQ